jgi:hypothetical protein
MEFGEEDEGVMSRIRLGSRVMVVPGQSLLCVDRQFLSQRVAVAKLCSEAVDPFNGVDEGIWSIL